MYSTQYNCTDSVPPVDEDSCVGRYLTLPDRAEARRAEGGQRTVGRYKRRSVENPLVSVITTTFNAGRFIEQAICSVLTQTYRNIEYIVVDAASRDQTLRVLRKYEDAIDYFVSEPDEGLYEGMNKGLELAQGDFVIVLNADDWYEPRCIETLVGAACRQKHDVVSALATETDVYGNVIRKIPMMPFGDNVRLRMPLRHETMLVTRRIYEALGPYDTAYKLIADLKFTQDIYDTKVRYSQLDQYLMYFRKIGVAHELSEELLSERRLLLRERFDYLAEEEIGLLAESYTGDSGEYRRIMSRYQTRKDLCEAIEGFLGLHGEAGAAVPVLGNQTATR